MEWLMVVYNLKFFVNTYLIYLETVKFYFIFLKPN